VVAVVVGSAWAAHLDQFRWTLVGTAIGVVLAGTPYLAMTI
jgi:uncharacterized membrane protein